MSPNGQRTHSLDKYAFFRLDNVSSSTLTWLLTLALEDLLVEVNRPAHKISGPSQEYRRCCQFLTMISTVFDHDFDIQGLTSFLPLFGWRIYFTT